MTHTEILTLSGPSLSEAVAEHVMRWRRMPQSEGTDRMGSVWEDAKKDWHLIPRQPLRPGDAKLFAIVAEVWEPHRDMGAAWMAFMAAPGETKTLQAREGRFYAVIEDGDRIDGESPELAMCQASLLAILAP